ncbi:MAG: dCTP deaminase domain-containing protein [Rhodospirillales bacterium]
MTFWSTQTLQARLKNEKIVSPYCPDRTREACHALSMGHEHLTTKEPTYFGLNKFYPRLPIRTLKERQSFNIPSGHFGFLLTKEALDMPHDAIGFISIASSVKFHGLVNISGFHIDPGYKGNVIFSVYNAGPADVTIREGDQIFQLWVASLDQPDATPRTKDGFTNIPSDIANKINGDVVSPQSLSIRIDKLNNKIRVWKWVAQFTALLWVAYAVLFYDRLFERLSEIISTAAR